MIAAADSLVAGDRVRLLPGDRVPVDGVVADGVSLVNEAMLTGEPRGSLDRTCFYILAHTYFGTQHLHTCFIYIYYIIYIYSHICWRKHVRSFGHILPTIFEILVF